MNPLLILRNAFTSFKAKNEFEMQINCELLNPDRSNFTTLIRIGQLFALGERKDSSVKC